jgi:hypothetical protein
VPVPAVLATGMDDEAPPLQQAGAQRGRRAKRRAERDRDGRFSQAPTPTGAQDATAEDDSENKDPDGKNSRSSMTDIHST